MAKHSSQSSSPAAAAPDPKQLFQEWVAAAKTLDWHGSQDAGFFQRESREPGDEGYWDSELEEKLRIVFPHDQIFHLQIRLEKREMSEHRRFRVLGRRVNALNSSVSSTQRATFNGAHADECGFVLCPKLNPDKKMRLARRLPGPWFPRWNGRHIQLGSDQSYVCLRRFLIALAAIEEAKGKWDPSPLPFSSEAEKQEPEFEPADLDSLMTIEEGRQSTLSASRRLRCQRLLGEAREHFRRLDPDGRLICQVCGWHPSVPTRAEIVQIHHRLPLSSYPPKGLRLTLTEAIANLIPLCPNCHRMLESHPNGGCYGLDELATFAARKSP
jgi:hypothetical protein